MTPLPHQLECLPQTGLKHLASLNEISHIPLISFKGNLVYYNKSVLPLQNIPITFVQTAGVITN